MTPDTVKKIQELIDQISFDNHPLTLDDDGPDVIADSEKESIEELVDYLNERLLGGV